MFRYYFILLIFFISNIFSQEISPIQSFTASDYDGDIQNWMITQAEDNSIVVANSSGILHYNRDWNFYPSSKNTIFR
jgi:AraC family chitin signaling transcriptional activator